MKKVRDQVKKYETQIDVIAFIGFFTLLIYSLK
jgi:hypothetical protein